MEARGGWEATQCGFPQSSPMKYMREVASQRTIRQSPKAWLPTQSRATLKPPIHLSPLGLPLTFKVEVGPIAQENIGCLGQSQLGHLQQGIAHAFLVKRRVGLSLQQLSENENPALLTGDITGPGAGERQTS